MTSAIVTSTYRYKPPPKRKRRKLAALVAAVPLAIASPASADDELAKPGAAPDLTLLCASDNSPQANPVVVEIWFGPRILSWGGFLHPLHATRTALNFDSEKPKNRERTTGEISRVTGRWSLDHYLNNYRQDWGRGSCQTAEPKF
jgi:hypothetical protein